MSEAAIAVPAATILMLRNGPTGLEVFMVVRHHQIDFASGALVFPGGKVDKGDSEIRSFCDGANTADDTQLSLMVGAVREAFEECGILLARTTGETNLVSGDRLNSLEHYRDPLNKNEVTIAEFLEKENLTLACDLLQPFAHWITPDMMPKRFDTYFYLALAPGDHVAIHDGYESVDSIWISPANALKGAEEGTYTIIFPTRLNIEMLGESDSVDNALAAARDRTIVPVTPWTEKRDDGVYLCIPEDAGYQASSAKMEA